MNAIANIDLLYIEEDEEDIQKLEQAFKKINELLNIGIAHDGLEALNKLYGRSGEEKLTPKLIILDINLPKLSGAELLKVLRADPDFSTVPVYILTDAFTSEDKQALRHLNISDHIIKPLEYSDALKLFWLLLSEQNN